VLDALDVAALVLDHEDGRETGRHGFSTAAPVAGELEAGGLF
jgi:hypothetical protein